MSLYQTTLNLQGRINKPDGSNKYFNDTGKEKIFKNKMIASNIRSNDFFHSPVSKKEEKESEREREEKQLICQTPPRIVFNPKNLSTRFDAFFRGDIHIDADAIQQAKNEERNRLQLINQLKQKTYNNAVQQMLVIVLISVSAVSIQLQLSSFFESYKAWIFSFITLIQIVLIVLLLTVLNRKE